MGKDPKTTIEINGKRYDARTGRQIGSDVKAATAKPVVKTKASVSDIRRSANQSPSHRLHSKTERSHTLMRTGLKKPAAALRLGRAKTMLDVIGPAKSAGAAPLALGNKIKEDRAGRAKQVSRSNLVTRFSDVLQKPISFPSITAMQQHPAEAPISTQVEPMPVKPHPDAHKTAVRPAGSYRSETMLAKGLAHASSHLEKPHTTAKKARTKHRRGLGIAAGTMAAVLLAGFFFLQNAANLAVRYASARAGVSASLPSYQPSGFAISNQIEYSPGAVTVSFKSNTDSRNFEITQKSSSWDSEALKSNYVAATSDSVQTVEDKGRTIYLYGDSNATWVNGGVWYDISGSSKLNSEQLIKIAGSM